MAVGCGNGSGSGAGGGLGVGRRDPAGVGAARRRYAGGGRPRAGVRAERTRRSSGCIPCEGDLQLTADSGLALLELDSLPPTFLVVVRGGRAEGRTLRGSLSARVRDYRYGTVVQVTPVTSLVERWERGEPSVDRTAEVHAALGIPDWADEFDLHATDEWFDGDAFLAYTDGDLARALPQMVAEIERGENEIFPGEGDRELGAARAAAR